MVPFIIGTICGVVVVMLALYWRRLYQRDQRHSEAGKQGELAVSRRLRGSLNKRNYHLIDDVTLRDRLGSNQIDHILISRFGIFVIETKDRGGSISGSAEDAEWIQSIGVRRHSFQNPLRQNHAHIKALINRTTLQPGVFRSLVVFTDRGVFQAQLPDGVVKLEDLIVHISQFREEVLPYAEMVKAVGRIHMACEERGSLTVERHKADLRRRHPAR